MCLILGAGLRQRPFFMGKVIRIDFPTRKKVCPVINVFPGHMSKLILRRRKVRSILNLGVEGRANCGVSHSRRYELNLAAVGAFDCAATHTWLCSGVFPTVTW